VQQSFGNGSLPSNDAQIMFYKGERGSVIILREISFEAMIQIMFCGM
jgi:hypothetical protein